MNIQNQYIIKPNGSKVLGIPMGTTLESKQPLNPEHFICLSELLEKGNRYPRKNSITGKGMTEGYIFNDGDFYCETKTHALHYAKENGYKTLEESYNDGFSYHTEWDCENDGIAVIEFEGVHYDVENFEL